MMKYRYKIKPLAQRKIRSFYYNVAKKYKHTYSKWLMYKNIDDAERWTKMIMAKYTIYDIRYGKFGEEE